MDIKKLQTAVVDALEDVKAQDIRIYDTTHLTSLFDRVIIAAGTSNRQTKALAASVRDKVKAQGGTVVSMEGEGTGEWVLVDLGDVIVHIMQPAIRAYYRLEEIWGDKEIKVGAAKRTTSSTTAKQATSDAPLPKRSRHLTVLASQATEDDEAPKKTVRKPRTSTTAPTTEKVSASQTIGARKTAEAKQRTTAKKPAVKKAVGKTIKVASPKSASAVRKTPVKRTSRAKADD